MESRCLGEMGCVLLALMLWVGASYHSVKPRTGSSVEQRVSMDRGKTRMNTSTRAAVTEVTGTWGGNHISMEVTESGAELNYDCAHGAISEKIVPGPDGKFLVKGSHTTEHPGPVRVGREATAQPATYGGAISGDTMELTVTLSGSNQEIGTFSLTRGNTGRIRKCR